jgi:hypothetical protein
LGAALIMADLLVLLCVSVIIQYGQGLARAAGNDTSHGMFRPSPARIKRKKKTREKGCEIEQAQKFKAKPSFLRVTRRKTDTSDPYVSQRQTPF